MKKKYPLVKILLAAALAVTALFPAQAEPKAVPKTWPSKMVFGFLPNEEGDPDRKAALKILQKEITDYVGVPFEIVICEDYNAVIETMRNKKTQLAYFGPFSYILAHDRSKAEAIVVGAKEGKKENAFYSSVFITHSATGIKTLKDVKGKKMAFVDPVSTSGNLVPRSIFVKQFGLKPEEIDTKLFGSIQFSGSHNNSLLAVANRSVDLAAVTRATYETGVKKGTVKAEDVVIFHESDPIPNSPIAVYGDLPSDLKAKIKEFFLTWNNEEFHKLRNAVGTRYVEIRDADYNSIRAIARLMNMKSEDLLK